MGSLTRKARIKNSESLDVRGGDIVSKIIDRELCERESIISEINSGREAVRVYISIYNLAAIRSGWYPHRIMRAAVGISVDSNAI